MKRMQTSRTGLELIKSFEGFRPQALRLGKDDGWVIGYGHTKSARAKLSISRDDAEAILARYDLPPVENAVRDAVYAPLNQNEFDALVSFVFNIGIEAFHGSDVLARLNSGEKLAAANAMSAWRRAKLDGRLIVVDALVRRRAVEIALFLEHPGGRRSAPTALLRPKLDVAAAIMAPRERAVIVEENRNGDSLELRQQAETTETVANDTTDVAPVDQTAPEIAARAVSERLTRILGEASGPSARRSGDGVSVDEITAAVSALADPLPDTAHSDARASTTVIDDLEPPAEIAMQDIERAISVEADIESEDNFRDVLNWASYAFMSFLGVLIFAWGILKMVRLSNAGTLMSSGPLTPGPFMMLIGGLLFIVMSYYLYRAVTERD